MLYSSGCSIRVFIPTAACLEQRHVLSLRRAVFFLVCVFIMFGFAASFRPCCCLLSFLSSYCCATHRLTHCGFDPCVSTHGAPPAHRPPSPLRVVRGAALPRVGVPLFLACSACPFGQDPGQQLYVYKTTAHLPRLHHGCVRKPGQSTPLGVVQPPAIPLHTARSLGPRLSPASPQHSKRRETEQQVDAHICRIIGRTRSGLVQT